MGAATFDLNAKVACGRGRVDAVDNALREALETAALLPERTAEMRRGAREAHAALTAKGGCRAYPAADLAQIRARHEAREREITSGGGEMTMNLPAALGGKRTGRASYGTVAIEGIPMTVLCVESGPGSAATRLVLVSPQRTLIAEGRRDLSEAGARARLTIPSAATQPEIQYGMLSISEPEGTAVRGSLMGFLREGMEMFDLNFTAVPSPDPCGIKAEMSRP